MMTPYFHDPTKITTQWAISSFFLFPVHAYSHKICFMIYNNNAKTKKVVGGISDQDTLFHIT